MALFGNIKDQFRAAITWSDPEEWEIFRKFTGANDEIKNASTLIIQPGQGCIFTYEGKIEGTFSEPGMYNLETDNKPFVTTLKKFLNFFESEDKTIITIQ
jgi:membrane protease subunit (stomatin/prohibitin family)